MTDALCGPSNALQTFQKHNSVDRTLQQERLARQHSPVESFRSSLGPESQALDAEFEAFQSSNPLETGFPEPPSFYHSPPPTVPQHALEESSWASDFQNLQLDGRRDLPIPASQLHQYAPIHRRSPNAWQQEFVNGSRQSHARASQNDTRYQSSTFPPTALQHQLATPHQYAQTGFDRGWSAQDQVAQNRDSFEDSAFAKAFEEAQAEAMLAENQAVKNMPLPDSRFEDGISNDATTQYRIGSDRILDESQERAQSNESTDDGDDLARTAGQLLENIQGDSSKKFQESNFLSLMRQLRDREVKLDGDKFVDTHPLHPGGAGYPPDLSLAEENMQSEASSRQKSRDPPEPTYYSSLMT